MEKPETKQILAADSEEYRTLLDRHRQFETRLSELQRKRFLDPREQVECTNLKKQKLRLKDRMEALVREPRPGK